MFDGPLLLVDSIHLKGNRFVTDMKIKATVDPNLSYSPGDRFSKGPRKYFAPIKPLLVHLYLKTEKCIGLKLLV